MTRYFNLHTPDGFQVVNSQVQDNGTNVTLRWNTDTNFSSAAIFRDGQFLTLVEGTNAYTDDTAISNYVHQYTVNSLGQIAARPVATLTKERVTLGAGEADNITDMLSTNGYIFACTFTSPAKVLKVNITNLSDRVTTNLPHDYGLRIAYASNSLWVLCSNSTATIVEWCNPTTLANSNLINDTALDDPRALTTDNTNLFVAGSTNSVSLIKSYTIAGATAGIVDITNAVHPTSLAYFSGKLYAQGQLSGVGGGFENWYARLTTGLTKELVVNPRLFDAAFQTPSDDLTVGTDYVWGGYNNNLLVLDTARTDYSFPEGPPLPGEPPQFWRLSIPATLSGSVFLTAPCQGVTQVGEKVWFLYPVDPADKAHLFAFNIPTSAEFFAGGTHYDQYLTVYDLEQGEGYVGDVCGDSTNLVLCFPAVPSKLAVWRETVVDDVGNPSGTITHPPQNTFVSGTTNVTAISTDNVLLSHIEFLADRFGEWIVFATAYLDGTISTNTVAWDTTLFYNGFHSLAVRVHDAAGNFAWGNPIIGVTVSNYTPNPGITRWASNIAHSATSASGADAKALVLSGSNLVIGGIFAGTVNFAGTNITSAPGQSAGNDPTFDSWLAVFNTNGVRQWIASYTNANDARILSAAVDSSLNIFVSGFFSGTLNLGGTNLTAGDHISDTDPFVAKFNSAGVHQWSKRMGGTNGNYGRKVAVDSSGNVYHTGELYNAADFGGGTILSTGGTEVYLGKLSSSGAYVWQAAVAGTEYEFVYDIAVDTNDNVYICGQTQGDLNFGNGSVANHGVPGSSDGFVARYNSSGSNVWAITVGGSLNDSASSMSVHGTDLFVVGTCRGTITLGDDTYNAATGNDVFWMARISLDTGEITQSRVVSYSSSIGGAIGPRSLAIDSDGNLTLFGNVSGEFDFGNGQLTSGTGNIFLAKYDSSFQYLWAKRVSTPVNGSLGYEVVIDASRSIYGIGKWLGTGNFDGFPLSAVSGAYDGFLIKSSP